LAVLLLLAYEAYGIYDTAAGDTISEWVWHFSDSTLFVFAAGVTGGHFFWQRKTPATCPACHHRLR
jgi:hypothetical protein